MEFRTHPEAEGGWSWLRQAGLRTLALRDSGVVFIERLDIPESLSIAAVRSVSAIESVATEYAIAFVNELERLEGVVDLKRSSNMRLYDFSTVRAIALAPELTRRLGFWKPRKKLHADLWLGDFTGTLADEELRSALKQLVLEPWLAERQPKPKGLLFIAADDESDAPEIVRADKAARSALGLDSATRAAVQAVTADEPTSETPDPVQKAIEIRDRLAKSVTFLDSGQWATLRGVTSNPSAALGKYKQQRRVFAVRSGKADRYPYFQFDQNAEPFPIMEQILKTVPASAQGWPLLSWFEARNTLLGGRKPSDALRDDASGVLEAATRFYSRDE